MSALEVRRIRERHCMRQVPDNQKKYAGSIYARLREIEFWTDAPFLLGVVIHFSVACVIAVKTMPYMTFKALAFFAILLSCSFVVTTFVLKKFVFRAWRNEAVKEFEEMLLSDDTYASTLEIMKKSDSSVHRQFSRIEKEIRFKAAEGSLSLVSIGNSGSVSLLDDGALSEVVK